VSDDVAAVLANIALGEPLNGMVEMAGPEPISMDEFIRKYLTANASSSSYPKAPGRNNSFLKHTSRPSPPIPERGARYPQNARMLGLVQICVLSEAHRKHWLAIQIGRGPTQDYSH
jgi:hypothetical protein